MSNVLTTVRKGRAILVISLVCVTAVMIAGCGSSSSGGTSASAGAVGAQTLLKQTFQGKHSVKSGKLSVNLTVVPKGSSAISDPITLSFGGPFQATGDGNVPDSNFTVAASIQGQHIDLSVISAAGHGYITARGDSYRLPESDYQKLESGFSSVSGSGSESSSPFHAKGVEPLSWLTNSTIVGHATIDGAPTTHIHSIVDVSAMLAQISKLVGDTEKLGVPDTSTLTKLLTPAEIKKLAKALGKPDFNVWTGTSDHTVRKLTVTDNVPVSGSLSTDLGGLKSAVVNLTFAYSEINEPQTINAPTELKPYTEFEQLVRGLLGSAESGVVGATSGGSSTSTASANPAGDAKYSACITKADGDVTKMQKCSSLLR